ncbi:CotH kinase family protein [Sunxiuqinia sp. sy24]|uniref:CotH kinase family protein n=1 Tax=Sunxiuqinia sp. sy24 TaxID=3461495 RepID=UPI00404637E7
MNRTKIIILCLCLLTGISAFSQLNSDFHSHLPLVIINTNGQQIVDDPKIMANLKIIFKEDGSPNYLTDEPTDYNGLVGIEIRGKSSASYPQTPYLFETRNADGSNNNVPLLGMPAENDWCLLSFYNDKSLVRNTLSFETFRQMGHYAPRTRHCELILNNQYRGIYLLTEKIKQDKNRVDVAKLRPEDNEGDELTGGYIFKIDYFEDGDSWTSAYSPIDHPDFNVHFVYHDPAAKDLTSQQKNYIKNYIFSFEAALYSNYFNSEQNGYSAYLGKQSFIDYFLISEVSRNNDGFKKSRYFYKEKNGSLFAGPVWDFDWAWKNINECAIFKATDGSGWAYQINDCNPWVKSPGWMIRLFQDAQFANATNCNYFSYRESILKESALFAIIDSVYKLVEPAQSRHFNQWKILGINVGAPEVDAQPSTYQGEVQKLKNWISTRLNWLDDNMIGDCYPTAVVPDLADLELKVYPNPAMHYLTVASNTPIEQIMLYDSHGTMIKTLTPFGNQQTLDLSTIANGLILLKIQMANGEQRTEKVMVNH